MTNQATLWRGTCFMTLINGTCVAINGQGVLIRGPSGSGKSDLALRLIDGGASLVSDDYCQIGLKDGVLTLKAPPPIKDKLEVRGYGIVKLTALAFVSVDLVVDLINDSEVDRIPDSNTCFVEGIKLKHLVLNAHTPSSAAKVRLALQITPDSF